LLIIEAPVLSWLVKELRILFSKIFPNGTVSGPVLSQFHALPTIIFGDNKMMT
jgi:hypothetical protein